jgi:hypothetical protein
MDDLQRKVACAAPRAPAKTFEFRENFRTDHCASPALYGGGAFFSKYVPI